MHVYMYMYDIDISAQIATCACTVCVHPVLGLQQLLDITRCLLEKPDGVQEEVHKLQQLKAVLEM